MGIVDDRYHGVEGLGAVGFLRSPGAGGEEIGSDGAGWAFVVDDLGVGDVGESDQMGLACNGI
jgi:hypothetical protein